MIKAFRCSVCDSPVLLEPGEEHGKLYDKELDMEFCGKWCRKRWEEDQKA